MGGGDRQKHCLGTNYVKNCRLPHPNNCSDEIDNLASLCSVNSIWPGNAILNGLQK